MMEQEKALGTRQMVKGFLFSKAEEFLKKNSVRHAKTGEALLPRRERRKAARELANRMSKEAMVGRI